MEENFQIRDLFNHKNITALGERILNSYAAFDLNKYLGMLIPAIDALTYSERKNAITDALEKYLPTNFESTVEILLKSLPPPYETNDIDSSSDTFMVTAMTQYVSRNGIDFPELSMKALYEMTKASTAEWDIRPFITRYPDYCKKVLLQWSQDENAHIRRLVSEGTRPYLPWGMKLHMVEKNPDWSLELLQNLKYDESLYVRRSVANHLNDLSKKHAEKVISVLTSWKKEHDNKEMSQLIKHALRTLIKRGNPGALQLLGFPTQVDIELRIGLRRSLLIMASTFKRQMAQCNLKFSNYHHLNWQQVQQNI